MVELPENGNQGEIWSVRVPVVFDVAARSWRQAKDIVDNAVTAMAWAGAPAQRAGEGIVSWAHGQDAYPARDLPASLHQTFLADLTTVEVLRVLVGEEAKLPSPSRVLTEAELHQLEVTLAAADRYVEIPNPEFPESEPLFAGHASEAAGEVPEGLYDATDIAGRPVQLLVGPSRLGANGVAAATVPRGNIDSRALGDIDQILRRFDRTQQPAAALEQISAIVRRTGGDGLDPRTLLATRAAATRHRPVAVGVITWSDDPEVEPTIHIGPHSTALARQLAEEVYQELADSEAFAGGEEFLRAHAPLSEWRTPADVDRWLEALREATPYPQVTLTQLPLAEVPPVGQQASRQIASALIRRESDLHQGTAPTGHGPSQGPSVTR